MEMTGRSHLSVLASEGSGSQSPRERAQRAACRATVAVLGLRARERAEREEKGGDWAGTREGKEGALGHKVWRPT